MDWKVATSHWKKDCLIHGGWNPTVQSRTGPGHQDENLHEQPYVPDGRHALHISLPSQTLLEDLSRPSTGFTVRCHPLSPRKRLWGKTENAWLCNTNQDTWIHSSHGLSESTGEGHRTSFKWKQGREVPSLQWIHFATQADANATAVLKICLVLLLSWGGGTYQFIRSPESQQCRSWSGWKPFCSVSSETFRTTQSLASILHAAALRSCFLQLPWRTHRCCFFCGSSLAVYFAHEA